MAVFTSFNYVGMLPKLRKIFKYGPVDYRLIMIIGWLMRCGTKMLTIEEPGFLRPEIQLPTYTQY